MIYCILYFLPSFDHLTTIKSFIIAFLLFPSYECDCEGTGFVGNHCEDDIPECASNPCKHGATCLEGINLYKCHCWPGILWFNTRPDINQLFNIAAVTHKPTHHHNFLHSFCTQHTIITI